MQFHHLTCIKSIITLNIFSVKNHFCFINFDKKISTFLVESKRNVVEKIYSLRRKRRKLPSGTTNVAIKYEKLRGIKKIPSHHTKKFSRYRRSDFKQLNAAKKFPSILIHVGIRKNFFN